MPLTFSRLATGRLHLAGPGNLRKVWPIDRVLTAIFYVAVALSAAALAHLAAVLALPWRAKHDAYDRVWELVHHQMFVTVPGPALADRIFPYQDPLLSTAFCAFDLRDGPVHISLDVSGTDFATVSAHSRHGVTFYGLTNRSAANRSVSLVLMTRAQTASAAAADDDQSDDLRVTAPESEGFVVVEALATTPSAAAGAEATVRKLACTAVR